VGETLQSATVWVGCKRQKIRRSRIKDWGGGKKGWGEKETEETGNEKKGGRGLYNASRSPPEEK